MQPELKWQPVPGLGIGAWSQLLTGAADATEVRPPGSSPILLPGSHLQAWTWLS